MKIQPIRGTHDLYGDKLRKYKKVEKTINSYAKIYDFNEIITPIFESTDLFKKPLGEHSDVVLKEMYTFKDRNNSSLTLRPEYTTPILRAAISNNFLEKIPKKCFSFGPIFRRERPQKGRYRQFNQINFEILGSQDVMADVELILLSNNILKSLLPNKKIDLHINSLGDKNALKKFKNELRVYFEKNKNNLTHYSKDKIKTNPLRILDSKEPRDMETNKNAPKISDYYSKESKEKFYNIQNLLTEINIDYKVKNNLVRGLDYYCHTVFEFKTDELGSQDTLIGGGRYDGLIKILGGPDISGVGWAGGVERIIMLMDDLIENKKKVHFVIMDESYKNYGLKVINELRKNNIEVHFDYKYNIKKSLSIANQLNHEYAVIIGENELINNQCTIKNLNKNFQKTISIDELIKMLI
jgi:histidyl-tRNA synthetase